MPEELLALSSELEDDLQQDINIATEEDDPIEFKYSMSWYGADYPIDGLVKRIKKGDIYIPTFQRSYVWDIKQASLFIESLLLGLPVPGIFLTKDDNKKLIVIDGNQRLKTLEYFYNGVFEPTGKPFQLVDVREEFRKATYNSLSAENRRELDDSILHATIVRQDEPDKPDKPSDDNNSTYKSSIYLIFERLNTSGKVLAPQEVRSCVYHGDFKETLARLNQYQNWRAIYNGSDDADKRLRDEELILRFIALFNTHQEYRKPMRNFLNIYMKKNQNKSSKVSSTEDLFIQAVDLIHEVIGKKAFRIRKGLNAAVFDAVMVGLATRISNNRSIQKDALKQAYDNLLKDQEFLKFVDTARTTENNAVQGRINLAIKAFAEI